MMGIIKRVKSLKLEIAKKEIIVLTYISPKLASKVMYKRSSGKKLNLKNPELFNEKLMWLKLNTYKNNELVKNCADKFRVREYVKEVGCEEILNDLISVYDSADEIDFDNLPQKFVLKCNHGAGYNIICIDKNKLDIEETKEKLNKWMKEEYYKYAAEIQYKNIEKKILCEKYLDMNTGKKNPTDYKIYCFNGEPKIILVMNDRDTAVTREFYNEKWERIQLRDNENPPKTPTAKPENLEQMLEYAKKLSKPFPFVRVDLYNVNGAIVFGELTFTPTGCMASYKEEVSKMMGEWIKL